MSELIYQILTRKKKGWIISIHPRHGSGNSNRKHVHIKKKGINGEYSWNDNGTRHDAHKFPSSEQAINRAKELAAEALGVSMSSLEFIANSKGDEFIEIAREFKNVEGPVCNDMEVYVPREKSGIVFEGTNSLIIVVEYVERLNLDDDGN